MTDELVKRLRESGTRSEVELHEDREEAADRIEALTADNARLQAIVSGMKAYLAGEPSNPPATGVKKVDLAALNTRKEPSHE